MAASKDQHPHGGQQGSTQHGGNNRAETKTSGNKIEDTGNGTGQRNETDEQRHGGDADNASETTGGSESGGEDRGAKE